MITRLDKNSALIVIDLQEGIVKFKGKIPPKVIIKYLFSKIFSITKMPSIKTVLKRAVLLVEAFRKNSLPIVFVNVEPKGNWLNARKDEKQPVPSEIPPEFLKIADELPTNPDDIYITKNTWNAFYNTSLHEELQKRAITNIVLCGVATSIGVEGTAKAARKLGYNISFATDVMTDMKISSHKNSIFSIFPRIGEVETSLDIIKKLPKIQ
jgi:nicotinamidase-related amidase